MSNKYEVNLSKSISMLDEIPQKEKDKYISGLQNMSDDELEKLTESLFSKFSK